MSSNSKSKKIDLYEILKVAKNATPAELRKAYLAMAKVTHPDKFPESERANATVAFQGLKKAFDVLNDPTLRDRYDRTGECCFFIFIFFHFVCLGELMIRCEIDSLTYFFLCIGVLPEDESDSFSTAYERFRGIKVTKADIEAAINQYRYVSIGVLGFYT